MTAEQAVVQQFDSLDLPLRNKTVALPKKLDEDEVVAAQQQPQYTHQIYTPFAA